MGQYLDGVSATASQHGAKQVSLPLQDDGNYFATLVRRNMIVAPASAYAPILATQTNYTQLLKWSDDLSQADWAKGAATGTAATTGTKDPEGGNTASKLAEDNTTAAHTVTNTMTVSAGALRAVVLLKAGERNFVRMYLGNATDGGLGTTIFNLSTGAVVSGTGAIKALMNGWYACFVFGTATVANSFLQIELSADGVSFNYLGTTGSGIYVWRATAYLASAYGPAIATTNATRAVTSYPVDTDTDGTVCDPTAFLVAETEPDQSALELGVARWVRSYANVPADTVVYGSRVITKPDPSGLGTTLGNYYASVAALGTSSASGKGTSYLSYGWAGNVIYGPIKTCTSTTSGSNRRITCTGHGVTTQDLLLYNSSPQVTKVTSSEYTVVDANTIDILNNNTDWTAIYIKFRAYTPGTDRVGTKNTQSFYLPGMTIGINATTDIPIPAVLLNDADFLASVIANLTGYQNYDATELLRWMGSEIYTQTKEQIDMADV